MCHAIFQQIFSSDFLLSFFSLHSHLPLIPFSLYSHLQKGKMKLQMKLSSDVFCCMRAKTKQTVTRMASFPVLTINHSSVIQFMNEELSSALTISWVFVINKKILIILRQWLQLQKNKRFVMISAKKCVTFCFGPQYEQLALHCLTLHIMSYHPAC